MVSDRLQNNVICLERLLFQTWLSLECLKTVRTSGRLWTNMAQVEDIITSYSATYIQVKTRISLFTISHWKCIIRAFSMEGYKHLTPLVPWN